MKLPEIPTLETVEAAHIEMSGATRSQFEGFRFSTCELLRISKASEEILNGIAEWGISSVQNGRGIREAGFGMIGGAFTSGFQLGLIVAMKQNEGIKD